MNRIIIFEGADRTGKTTISRALASLFGFQYFKSKKQADHFKNDTFINALKYEGAYFVDLLDQVSFQGNGIIVDRFIASEYAYSKTFNRKTDESFLFELDLKLALMKVVVVYCYKTDFSKIEYKDSLISVDKLDDIHKHYVEYFKKSAVHRIIIDTTNELLEEQLITIAKQLIKIWNVV